jgi:uncharacterized repeat protein (TIGR03809 family)
MTQRLNVAFSHDFAARGRALAERRLNHLTELYDSGRWKRYYTESEFLLNVRDARAAVDTWRRLELSNPSDRWKADPLPLRMDEEITSMPDPLDGFRRLAIALREERIEHGLLEERNSATNRETSVVAHVPSRRASLLPPIMFSADGVGSERDLGEM